MNYKPFDLEAAKAGKPVMMRDGTPIKRILAFDFGAAGYPILVSWIDERGEEYVTGRTIKGEFNLHGSCDPAGSAQDLVMVPEKVTKWVNVFKTHDDKNFGIQRTYLFDTENEAKQAVEDIGTRVPHSTSRYVATLPIEFTI